MGTNQLQEIRKNIEEYVGQKIVLKANKGRKRTVIREGILENTYPSIFIVRIDGQFEGHVRRVSYSYSDILTETVEITVCSGNKSIKVS
ncbi:MAG: Veg family protein [Natronincolaceae bacterium]